MENNGNFIKFNFEGISDVDIAVNILLSKSVESMNLDAASNKSKFYRMNGGDVERYSFDVFKRTAYEAKIDSSRIELISGQSFPDIRIRNTEYGVEVKSTQQNSWKSTGSSIVESTRLPDVDRIYMLFGKLGGTPEFKCKPYQDCLYDIAVTHSPRYLINMELQKPSTIFSKMGIDYDQFRLESESVKVSRVRRYYINEAQMKSKYRLRSGDMPWWVGETGVADWTFYNGLTSVEKNEMWVRMIILFPCIFDANVNEHYKKVALWLCDRYSLICYNMRDMFSAGGQVKEFAGVKLEKGFPALFGRLIKNMDKIKEMLDNPDRHLRMDIMDFWTFDYNPDDLYSSWKRVLINTVESNKNYTHVPIRELFSN